MFAHRKRVQELGNEVDHGAARRNEVFVVAVQFDAVDEHGVVEAAVVRRVGNGEHLARALGPLLVVAVFDRRRNQLGRAEDAVLGLDFARCGSVELVIVNTRRRAVQAAIACTLVVRQEAGAFPIPVEDVGVGRAVSGRRPHEHEAFRGGNK